MDQPTKRGYQRRTAAEWHKLIVEQADSGLPIRAFCAARGLGLSTFNKWKSRITNEVGGAAPAAGFVELSPPETASTTPWEVELALGEDIVLRVARRDVFTAVRFENLVALRADGHAQVVQRIIRVGASILKRRPAHGRALCFC